MDVRDLTRTLVEIPSHESEARAGDFVEDWLREHTTADVTRDAGGVDDAETGDTERDRGGNVIARKGSGEASLALVGHHDVVPPDESQIAADATGDGDASGGEYVVTERDGRLYGRGSADMKGSLAAAMVAFRDADPACELLFASFVGEEDGGVGARAAIDRGFAPDYAVVGEGSTAAYPAVDGEGTAPADATNVAVAHKGRRGSTVVAEGRAAHASELAAGENAIYRASDAVDVLRGVEFPETEVFDYRLAGSVAATEIEGGSAWNVIPDRCEVTVDERTVPGERAPLDRVEAVDGVTWRVDQDLPPMACDDPAFADAVLSATRDAHGNGDDTAGGATDAAPRQVVKPHATDAGWLADAGTTCVVCGAAESGQAHTADESVSLAVVERCVAIYRRLAETWTG